MASPAEENEDGQVQSVQITLYSVTDGLAEIAAGHKIAGQAGLIAERVHEDLRPAPLGDEYKRPEGWPKHIGSLGDRVTGNGWYVAQFIR